MDINKNDFVEQLISKYNYKKDSAISLVDDFWSVLIDNLESGNSVTFYGYGCFDLLVRKERRNIKNPRTKEPCVAPEHWVPRFYPGNIMKRAVKKWEDNQRRGLS